MSSPQPFTCTFTPNFVKVLWELKISLVLSTYQAGKLVVLSPTASGKLTQLPRTFRKAMGVAIAPDKMAIATLNEVLVLRNSTDLAQHYPKRPGVYDSLYLPRQTFHTGPLDIHDLEWGTDGLYAVNTLFSCLCRIDGTHSFTPIWEPKFISALQAQDRCHLNGMAMHEGQPTYVTAFNQGDQPKSWRTDLLRTGVIMEVDSKETICTGLSMPHSPRCYSEGLFFLQSGKGELNRLDLDSGQLETILHYPAFLRGLDRYGDYLFIGVSKPRASSNTFKQLDPRFQQANAGILIVHLPSGKLVAQVAYQQSVEEIYDVRVLADQLRPNLMNTHTDEHHLALHTPQATYWGQPNKVTAGHPK